MSDNPLLLRVPWRLRPGDKIEIGEAKIERLENGDVVACDTYGCAEARVPPGREVRAAPVPAIHRLITVTPYIYVEFERRVFIDAGEDYWALAPYEIEVYVEETVLTRLSPTPVKYTLIGDVVEGVLARWYRSPVEYEQAGLPDPTGTAVVRFLVRNSGVLLPGVGFNALNTRFFVDENGLLYYPLLHVDVEGNVVTVRSSGGPPLPGLRELVHTVRRSGLGAILQLVQPFTMTIEVVRTSITTP